MTSAQGDRSQTSGLQNGQRINFCCKSKNKTKQKFTDYQNRRFLLSIFRNLHFLLEVQWWHIGQQHSLTYACLRLKLSQIYTEWMTSVYVYAPETCKKYRLVIPEDRAKKTLVKRGLLWVIFSLVGITHIFPFLQNTNQWNYPLLIYLNFSWPIHISICVNPLSNESENHSLQGLIILPVGK